MDTPGLTAALHVDPADGVTMKDFTRSASPFVTVDLGNGVLTLYLSEVESLDQLMHVFAQARRVLVAALGEDPGVIVRPVSDNPHLMPGPLPVGVA